MKRPVLVLAGLALIAAIAWGVANFVALENAFHAVQERRARSMLTRATFDQWLASSPETAIRFREFEAYLARNGVARVAPAWSLTIGDIDRFSICGDAGFVMPPRAAWPNIVPALRLVRDEVMPAVGRVEVRSVFRSSVLNRCAGGASKSRHLSFSALDLVAADQPDNSRLFARLCKRWKHAGPASRWGLGAYFDPSAPNRNGRGRFHIDGTGWRSWGFSKTGATSGCRLIGSA